MKGVSFNMDKPFKTFDEQVAILNGSHDSNKKNNTVKKKVCKYLKK